jgi:hypothetical protein
MKRFLPMLLLLSAPAFAQTTNLVLTTTSSNSRVSSTLTWTNPAAASCAATGDSGWITAYNALTKPISGTVTLASVPPPNARSYTLTCTWPGDTTGTVAWTAPTTNTDGTPLTDLASYKVYFNTGIPSAVTAPGAQIKIVTAPATGTVITGLAVGVWNFGVVATNSKGMDSELSNIASKTMTTGATDSQTVTLAFPGTTIVTVK